MREEVEITHREEFQRVQSIVAREMTDPGECFVPMHSVKVTKEEGVWLVEVEFQGELESLEDARQNERRINSEQTLELVGSLLSSMRLACQIFAGGFKLSPAYVYISADCLSAKLSPLLTVSGSDKCVGLKSVLGVISELAREVSTEVSGLLTDLGNVVEREDCSAALGWFERERAKMYIHAVNCDIRRKRVNRKNTAANLHKVIHLLASAHVTLCMNPTCPGESTGCESICAVHPFCSLSCLQEAQEANASPDDQCPLCFLSNPKKTPLCVCGKSIDSEDTSWRISYYGSIVYNEVGNYCSEECFLAQQPSRPEEDPAESEDQPEFIKCLVCKREDLKDDCEDWHELDCHNHFFCTWNCYHRYRAALIPNKCHFWPHCLECSEALCALAEKRKITEEATRFIKRVDELKQTFARLGNVAAFSNMMNAINETEAMLNLSSPGNIVLGLTLSIKRISAKVYFLRCCNCGNPAVVHRRNRGEMVQWGDSPFLLKCAIQVHAVCSLACCLALQSKSEMCPVCLGFTLEFNLADVPRSVTHPTLEVLKRTANNVCWCRKRERFISLDVCAHEICSECLANLLLECSESLYKCPICLAVIEKDLLMSRVFV